MMKKLFIFTVVCSLLFSVFMLNTYADSTVSIGADQISDASRRNYVNAMLEYHLSEKGEKIISDSLNNGKIALFFFEGASNNSLNGSIYSDYGKYRFSSVCIIVRLVEGKPKIVFFDDFSSTIPDNPRNAYSHDEAIATLLDGVYPIVNCNHFGYAALHVPAYDWGTSIRCSKNEYYIDVCYGINIHNRDTDSITSNSKNSLGCLLVGKNASHSEKYNDFMFAATGIANARSSSFEKVAENCGCVIIDRALYKNELKKIYDAGIKDQNMIVNQITAYTDRINAFARKLITSGEQSQESSDIAEISSELSLDPLESTEEIISEISSETSEASVESSSESLIESSEEKSANTDETDETTDADEQSTADHSLIYIIIPASIIFVIVLIAVIKKLSAKKRK